MSNSAKFSLLTTDHLASDPNAEVTLQNLIATSDRLAEEAREVLPYTFDECTYWKGYLRQNVWSCLDCGEKGVCYGCSISCHAVELWTKRNFRCDCPTSAMHASGSNTAGPSRPRKCTLIAPDRQPQEPNEHNTYTQNFGGHFCRCGRDYDPETEEEAMVTCIACEDWYHESCLNLRPPKLPIPPSSTGGGGPPGAEADGDDDEEDDDEKDILIRSDTYDGLVCSRCVEGNEFLRRKSGEEGWMMIVPTAHGGGWEIIGRGDPRGEETPVRTGEKRAAPDDSEGAGENGGAAKRSRDADGHARGRDDWRRGGKGDIFLAHDVRDRLSSQLSPAEIASLPFPLVDAEIYEPPKDTDPDETLDEVTSRVMQGLPRVQAIEALHGYQRMKEKLSAMIAARAESGGVVSKEDIETFFSDLRASKAR